jgi:hypothetical protein
MSKSKKSEREIVIIREHCEECNKDILSAHAEQHRFTKTHKLNEERFARKEQKKNKKNSDSNSESKLEKAPIIKKQLYKRHPVVPHPFNNIDSDYEGDYVAKPKIIKKYNGLPPKNIQIKQCGNTVKIFRDGVEEEDTDGCGRRFAEEVISGIACGNLDIKKLLKEYGYA